ncbi:MAG TPA: ABC transporter permease [Candidatus Angelobacter sp.]|nr:ABC transporter permease [Candidatus Angelobacter sp.]
MSSLQRVAELARKARMLFSRRERFDHDLEEEMRLHRDLRAEEIHDSGATEPDSHAAAQRRFGNTLQLQEEIRRAWGWAWLDHLSQDLRYAVRVLRKSPGFTSIAVVTLALGIGANTAMFSLINSVLLRPLPYSDPDQIVSVFERNLARGIPANGCSYVDLLEIRRSETFAAVAGVQNHQLTLTGAGDPTVVETVVVTPEIFSILNVRPLAGRYLYAEDNTPGAAPAVVLSEGLWRGRFGADNTLVGHSIHLDQQAYTVVGIMPAGFRTPEAGPKQEVWIAAAKDPLFSAWMPSPGGHWLRLVAKLKSAGPLGPTQSRLDALSTQLIKQSPAQRTGWSLRVAPLQEVMVGEIRTPLLVLLGAVGLVLLLACVNIANLLLARATSRSREVALRQACGAGRGRIIRQFLTESALLGLLGAVIGVALAYSSIHALGLLLPANIAAQRPVELDVWVLGFALLISMAASIGFGLAPAVLTSRTDVQSNLKHGSAQSGSDRGSLRLRGLLTRAEIALAMVIVVAAGLLVRSLLKMTSVDPGYIAEHVIRADVSLPRYQYKTPQQWAAFSDALMERIQAQRGLEDSAVAVPPPMYGQVNLAFVIAGAAPLPPGAVQSANYVSVTPKYFGVMGIPLLRGRVFNPEDSASSPRVAIISATLARRYFKDENPVGKEVVFGFPPDTNITREVVGVVGDVRDVALTQDPGPMLYVPFAQAPFWGDVLVIKSSLPTGTIVAGIRQAVDAIDKNLPITEVEKLPDALETSIAQPKFRTWLLAAFGAVALLLAAAGVYGVVSYSVASRTKEFGVRATLGASPASIRKMVLREGVGLAGIGLAVGLAAALAVTQLLKSQLFGVPAYDPITFLLSAAILVAVALLACYLPARRAMRVDPMVALRYE